WRPAPRCDTRVRRVEAEIYPDRVHKLVREQFPRPPAAGQLHPVRVLQVPGRRDRRNPLIPRPNTVCRRCSRARVVPKNLRVTRLRHLTSSPGSTLLTPPRRHRRPRHCHGRPASAPSASRLRPTTEATTPVLDCARYERLSPSNPRTAVPSPTADSA